MSKLSRYIGTSVIWGIALVLFILVLLDMLFAVIDEADDIKGNYQFLQVLQFVFTTLPRRIYEWMHYSAMIGCLVGLGRLANNSELVVMRAAGMSLKKIVMVALTPALILMLFGAVIGEWIGPWSEKIAHENRQIQEKTKSLWRVKDTQWFRDESSYARFGERLEGNTFGQVLRIVLNDRKSIQAVMDASEAEYQKDHWLLKNVRVTYFDNGEVVSKVEDSVRWESTISPDYIGLNMAVVDPRFLSLRELNAFMEYNERQKLDSKSYELAFWRKLFQPFNTLVLAMLGVAFIFGPLRSVTISQRVSIGVLIGVVFKLIQDLSGEISLVYDIYPATAILVPIVFILAFAGYFLNRAAHGRT